MANLEFEKLIEAGAHFGHLKRKWNPAMAPYIFMERNGIHLIDLHKTIALAEEAGAAMKQIAKSGRKILFVATKKQAKNVVSEIASSINMPYVTERWPGGMLTNFPTIRKAVKKMSTIDKMIKDGTFETLSKRERLQITRQRAKLETNLGSIADLTRLPSALFIVDIMKEHIAVKEAQRLGIPIFAMVDTNSNPNGIDFIIPSNDDASESINLILSYLATQIKEGLQERKVEKIEQGDENKEEGAAPKRERKGRAVKKATTSSDDANIESENQHVIETDIVNKEEKEEEKGEK